MNLLSDAHSDPAQVSRGGQAKDLFSVFGCG
jgi:hypothetical protein